MTRTTHRFTRLVLLTVGLLVPTALLGILSAAQNHTPHPQTAKQKFKNIQVLKNLPADQLIPVMQIFDASLGVRCDFCHVIHADHSGFELDEKPMKAVARKMILLVNDINAHQKVVGGKATCFMCHHGRAEPETHAPAPPPPGERR